MTQYITYTLFDPTGNITALVETPVAIPDQPHVAKAIMQAEPLCEQVGFLSFPNPDGIALRMAGGEFCGNATMSTAVFYALRHGISIGNIAVTASGADGPVSVAVEQNADQSYCATVSMPSPLSVKEEFLPDCGNLPVVRFDGIAHVIVKQKFEPAKAEALAPIWCRALDASAIGMMFFDDLHSALTPLVYVPAADTLCWENSCASGTTAVGAYLTHCAKPPLSASLRQPGGTLTVTVLQEDNYSLTGTVKKIDTKTL